MPLQINQIDTFYNALEEEKNNTLQKMKENNIDKKEIKKLQSIFNNVTSLQSGLTKLRNIITPSLT